MSMWQPILIFAVSLALILGLFIFRISSLPSGIAKIERQTATDSSSLKAIVDKPLNAPYKTAVYLVNKLHFNVPSGRVLSATIAVVAIFLFYKFLLYFVKPLAAKLGTLLFATSSALLNNGRLASVNIMLLSLFMLLVAGYRMRFHIHHNISWLLAALVLGIALYTPGLVYFIILGIVWQYKAMKRDFDPVKGITLLASSIIFAVLIAPLIYGLVKHPELIRSYLLIPDVMPNIKELVLRFLAVPAGILAFAPKNPAFRLGRQALLDAFSVVMMLLGVYTLLRHYKLDRLKLLLAIFILGTLLVVISGDYEYSFILVPFVYFIVTIGLNTFLKFWRDVFPFNPLARSLAVSLLIVSVLVSVNFQTRRYFIAWSHNHETKAVFTPTK